MAEPHDELPHDPPPMRDGELRVELAERVPGDATKGWVPFYHFELWVDGHPDPVGHVNLRVGDTEHVVQHAGHVGYSVSRRFRGRRYAARATRMVLDFAHEIGMDEVWITSNPDNHASLRTLEILGAERVNEVDVPPGTDMHERGETRKVRFRVIATARSRRPPPGA
jgi:tagatose 1,6-diphosphate aldolase